MDFRASRCCAQSPRGSSDARASRRRCDFGRPSDARLARVRLSQLLDSSPAAFIAPVVGVSQRASCDDRADVSDLASLPLPRATCDGPVAARARAGPRHPADVVVPDPLPAAAQRDVSARAAQLELRSAACADRQSDVPFHASLGRREALQQQLRPGLFDLGPAVRDVHCREGAGGARRRRRHGDSGAAHRAVRASLPLPGEPLMFAIALILAQTAVSDAITVTATRTETRVADTPSSVVVLSKETIANSAAATTDDALRQVAGFTLFRRAGSRVANPTAQGVTLRGIGASGASRALVLDDGVPLNDPFGGWVYWSRVPRQAIERVEVVRGGASDLYGSGAMGGVVQFIRRTDAGASGEVSYGEQRS